MEVTWTLAVLTGGWRRSGVHAVKPAGSSVTRQGWCSACRRNIMEPTSPCTANTAPKTVQTPGDPVTTPYVRPSGGQGHGLRWGGGVNMCADLANVLLIMLMKIFYYFPLIALRDLIRGLELLMQNIGKTYIIQYGWFTLFFLFRQCSVTCGEGIQQRQVVCKASDNTAAECEGEKPETVIICELISCPGEG